MTGLMAAEAGPAGYLGLGVLLACCLAAAWLDLTQRRIPNWLCAITALAGLVAAVVPELSWGDLGSHAAHMGLALLGGMALFALGIFGGGDAKFYAAVAAWFPLGMGMMLLLDVALCGLVLLIVWFGWRRIRGLPVRKTGGAGFDGLPYGIAIGAGALVTMIVG